MSTAIRRNILPSRRRDETKAEFIDRCMGNPEAVRDFPRPDQRRAVCETRSAPPRASLTRRRWRHLRHIPRPPRGDPSRTTRIVRQYQADLARRWREVNRILRQLIVTDDVLGLGTPVGAFLQIGDLPGRFDFPADVPGKAAAFDRFMRELLDAEVLELSPISGTGSGWQNKYIRASYSVGVQHADASLRAVGVEPPPGALAQTLNQPIHAEKLQLLFSRNFNELQGVTNAQAQSLSRIVTEGLATGQSPRVVAAEISRSISSIGVNRGRVIARTETIRAHATATLARFEQSGIETVEGFVEFLTAGDDRVSNCKWSPILTTEGARPIALVKPGDLVLTRDGYKPVLATSVRSYRGPMVRIVTARGTEICTAEHPIFVRNSGWVDASGIQAGDVLEAPGNQPIEVRSVRHFLIGDPAYTPSVLAQIRRFAGVFFGVLVPIDVIHLQGDSLGNEKKIYPTITDLSLLDVFKTKAIQAFAHLALQVRLALEGASTADGAEPGLVSLLAVAKRRAAVLAIALLDGVTPPRGPSAFDGAVSVSFLVRGSNGETLATLGADLGHLVAVGSHLSVTDPRAEPVPVVKSPGPVNLSAPLALDVEDLTLPCPITRLGAEDMRGAPVFSRIRATRERFLAGIADKVKRHWYSLRRELHITTCNLLAEVPVYNLQVEGKPEYFSSGILVKNCQLCQDLEGQRFPLDEAASIIPVHANCRCVWLPIPNPDAPSFRTPEFFQ